MPGPESQFRKISQDIKTFNASVEKRKEQEQKGADYPREDSTLKMFATRFYTVLPPDRRIGLAEEAFRNYVETTLAAEKGQASAIEFGGVGYNLFGGFSQGFFKKTLGVALIDRPHRYLNYTADKENLKYHTVLEANLADPGAKNKILDWLAGDRPSLIIQNMMIGLDYVPQRDYQQEKAMRYWYHALEENGLIFSSVPEILTFDDDSDPPRFLEWVKRVEDFGQGKIDIECDGRSMSLHKKVGAPKSLPRFADLEGTI